MKIKNYFPFALREIRQVGAQNFPAGVLPSTSSVQISSLDCGFGDRVILGDLNVYAYQGEGEPSTQLLMRVGWLGKGFLLEKRIPAGLFINKSRPGVPVWKFTKPYILWPNQQLKARIRRRLDTDGALGLALHGRRMVDDRPIIIYDTTEADVAQNAAAVGFSDPTLKAPGDSPVELHSVAITDWDHDKTANVSEVQIWSPGGREWFQNTQFVGPPPPADQRWIDPPTELFELGEDNGWVIGAGQTFLVEFENLSTSNINVVVTLRGSIELEEDHHG